MNRLIYIYILLIALFVQACSSAEMQKEAAMPLEKEEASTEELKEETEASENERADMVRSTTLDNDQLQVFQTVAIQKVNELQDYLKVIADTSFDMELREHTYGLALELFDEKSKVATEDLEMPVHLFLQYVLANDTTYGDYAIENIEIDSVLTLKRKRGLLRCTISGIESSSNDCTIQFKLKRQRKLFGQKEQEVWRVFLGDIEPVE